MVNRQAALRNELLQIAKAQAEVQVPADASDDRALSKKLNAENNAQCP
jgi:hypothetical protein